MPDDFEAILSRLVGEGPGESRDVEPTQSLDVQLAMLCDMAQRFAAPCPFRAGDIVTVRDNSDLRGSGAPHAVVEVFDEPYVDADSEAGSNRFLCKYTMRVAHFHGDTLTTHAVEHASFEAWTDTHAAAWKAKRSHTGRARLRVKPTTPLNEIVRGLRSESKRMADAMITWKKGEIVEILGHELSRASKPMKFEGKAVGIVERIDHSDDTTRVLYFDSDGDRCFQWFRPADLRVFPFVEPVPE